MSINVNVGTIIPAEVVEVGNEITAQQLAAITSAVGASGLNPFSVQSHTHTIANVTGLQTAIDGKANVSHLHTISNITGLQIALDGKSGVGHSHEISGVTGLLDALDAKANLSHTHVIADVTGLQTALDSKLSASHNHDGVYAPISHTHTVTDVTGLQTALLDLQTAIAGKANTIHTHAEYALLTGATFSGKISTPQIGNLLNAELIIDSYNDTGAGTHYYHKFTPFDGRFVLAPNGGGLVFPDATIQSTASYSKAQSDSHLTTVAGWVDSKASKSGDTFTGKVNFTPVSGVAGLNIGIGGTSTDSITNGDLWISTGGANLNFRDGTGAWRIVASTSNTNTFSAPQIIDTTSTNAGLRVTQKGTGNAFVVEDETTPDTSAFAISSTGRVGININPATQATGADFAVVMRSGSGSACYFNSTGGTTLNILNSTASSLGLHVSGGISRFDGGTMIGSTGTKIDAFSGPFSGTGTYNLEMAIYINNTHYRIPCRQF